MTTINPNDHIGLIWQTAIRVKGLYSPDMHVEELVGYGWDGLLMACKGYDASLGFAFSTYAVRWIFQAMQVAVRNDHGSGPRMPRQRYDQFLKLKTARNDLFSRFGRNASESELAAHLGWSASTLRNVLRAESLTKTTPLNALAVREDEGSDFIGDTITQTSPDALDMVIANELRQLINTNLDTLPYRERRIVEHLYGLNKREELSANEVGQKFDLTENRIHQLHRGALAKLRQVFGSPN